MTKSVWQYGRSGGQYIGEWEDDATLQVPYTDEPPLEGELPDGSEITIDDQVFIPSKNCWQLIKRTVDAERLEVLNSLYDSQGKELSDCKNQLIDTQVAVAEVYEFMASKEE